MIETALILDPSSSKTGYAVIGSDLSILDGGKITPPHRETPFLGKVKALADDIVLLCAETKADRIVVECPSGKVGRSHKGGGAGLTRYGFAAGAAYLACLNFSPGVTYGVWENDWTAAHRNGGRKKTKRERALDLCITDKAYRDIMDQDCGFDIADAILIGRYFWAMYRTNPKFGHWEEF